MTTINSQEDFLRALRENPEWREAVRALILGEEMLNLPAALQKLAETVDRFVARQELFNDEQRQFNSEQRIFNDEQGQFNSEQRLFNDEQRQFNSNALNRFDRMEGDISYWKRDYSERRVLDRSEAIPLGLGLKFVRIVPFRELTEMALEAAKGEALTADLKSFMDADLVIMADDKGETKYLDVEISYTAAPRDTRRAMRNARVLTEQTGCPSIPVIASSRNTREVQYEVDSGQIHWHYIHDREARDQ